VHGLLARRRAAAAVHRGARAKQVKNRVHLDLEPVEGSREEELARLLALGAREVADLRRPDGTGWVVLADPEGNEFCILRPRAEREPAG
jgi:hypothetical protein